MVVEVLNLRVLPFGVLLEGLRHDIVRDQGTLLPENLKIVEGAGHREGYAVHRDFQQVPARLQRAAGGLPHKGSVFSVRRLEPGSRVHAGRKGVPSCQHIEMALLSLLVARIDDGVFQRKDDLVISAIVVAQVEDDVLVATFQVCLNLLGKLRHRRVPTSADVVLDEVGVLVQLVDQ